MASDRSPVHVPPRVEQAGALAERLRFTQSCWPEVGRLLAVLAGHVRDGLIGEIGTGCGVGTAWMTSALSPAAELITIEADTTRAEAARTIFAPVPNVRVLQGDWHELLPYGPFDMLFADGGAAKQREPEVLLHALRPGGLIVLDDLTPEDRCPRSGATSPTPCERSGSTSRGWRRRRS